LELLIARGADVRAATKRGITALAFAAPYGNTEIVKMLLDKGAEINSKDDGGYTPLMLAAYSDFLNAAVVKMMLEKGAPIDARGNDGETALTLARKKGNTEVVQLLLNHDHKLAAGGLR